MEKPLSPQVLCLSLWGLERRLEGAERLRSPAGGVMVEEIVFVFMFMNNKKRKKKKLE